MQKTIELGIRERVTWHGFVADHKLIYPKLDVCVVPSRYHDPLPTAALEAGFLGRPPSSPAVAALARDC